MSSLSHVERQTSLALTQAGTAKPSNTKPTLDLPKLGTLAHGGNVFLLQTKAILSQSNELTMLSKRMTMVSVQRIQK